MRLYLDGRLCVLVFALVAIELIAANKIIASNEPASADFALDTRFNTAWDEAWVHTPRNGLCELQHKIAGYGVVRFVASRDTPTQFEFQASRDLQAGDLDIWRKAPGWHPDVSSRTHIGAAHHVVGGGSVQGGSLVDAMVLSLRDGYHLQFTARSVVGDTVDLHWEVKAVNFLAAYDEFLTCARTRIRVAWAEISKTRVPFSVGSHTLDQSGTAHLDAIIQYLNSDPAVSQLYIDGHTDSSGDKRSNYQLSKRRAQIVADYMEKSGISAERIVVRYHGAAYPAADNKTATGKARNRRTTVRLERGEPRLASNTAAER